MKKIIALIGIIVCLAGCSVNVNVNSNPTASPAQVSSDTQENGSPFSYSNYMGMWYGYGTDGEDALFQTMLVPIDDNSFIFNEKGYNGNGSEEHSYTMHLESPSLAKSDEFENGSDDKLKLVIEFEQGKSGELYFNAYCVYADTNEQYGESSFHTRKDKMGDAWKDCYQ